MWTVQSIKAITNGIVAIVGLLFVLWGSGSFSRRLNWKIGIGVPLAGLGIFALSLEDSGFGNALSVVATLMLAFAAFWSVSTTIEHQRSIASEQRDLDFKRRSMDEVMQWVRGVQQGLFKSPESRLLTLGTQWMSLAVEGFQAVRVANIFGSELEAEVKTLQTNIQELGIEYQDSASLSGAEFEEKFAGKIGECWQLSFKILDIVFRLKAEKEL